MRSSRSGFPATCSSWTPQSYASRWRLARGEPRDLEEAAEIIETLLSRAQRPRYLVDRADVAARRGDRELAWVSLLAIHSGNSRPTRPVAQRALALARTLGDSPWPDLMSGLEALARGRRPAVRSASLEE